MLLMVGFSLVLSNSVSATVLRPLEQLLAQVRRMASTIFSSVCDMACVMREDVSEYDQDLAGETSEGNKEAILAFGGETKLLEKVLQKLATLSEITMTGAVLDADA